MARRRRVDADDTEINITPMLDIVFIMLIFFIVSTSFTRETGALISRPQAAQAVALPDAAILIGVRPDGEIWMAGRQIELRELRSMVERARAENPQGSVVIVADQGSRIGAVTQVMDQLKLAGIKGISIAADVAGE